MYNHKTSSMCWKIKKNEEIFDGLAFLTYLEKNKITRKNRKVNAVKAFNLDRDTISEMSADLAHLYFLDAT